MGHCDQAKDRARRHDIGLHRPSSRCQSASTFSRLFVSVALYTAAGPTAVRGKIAASVPSKTLTPGVHLGPYQVVSLLGVGGMGEEPQSPVASRQSSVPIGDSGLVTEDWRLTTTSPCR